MKLIAFTGHAGSGKDEAAKVLIEGLGFQRIAFADPMRTALYALNPIIGYRAMSGSLLDLKEAVDSLGWDEAKRRYVEVRELLQRFGTEVGRQQFGQDFWVKLAMDNASMFQRVVITDCRFPNEAQAVLKAGGQVVRITRPGVQPVNGHISDKGLPDHLVSAEIANDGTIEDLRAKVKAFVDTL